MSQVRLPFQSRILHFEFPNEQCQLPFAVGGATQHHWDAAIECQNSQDALAISIQRKAIVAIVADGCTSTHSSLEASSRSSNEVGAKLVAYLALRITLNEISGHPQLSPDRLTERINRALRNKLSLLLRTFTGSDANRREAFTFDFLMTTVLGFVVVDDRFLVFHCGDGIVGLNGKIQVLDDSSGIYMGNDLLGRAFDSQNREARLKVFASGATSDLNSIFLATDGLCRMIQDYPSETSSFTDASPPDNQINNGFDFLLQEFRQKLAWNPNVALKLDDDATFALLRRCK